MIKINDLNFSYKRNKLVTNNVNLNIQKGYIHGLLGKNGTGKTTLLKLIAGLLFPDSGKIEVMGFNPQKRQVGFLSNVFFLPEEFDVYKMSIEDYVKTHAPFYPNFSMDDFDDFLNEFEIYNKKEKLTSLSFGTRKKVIIAFGLATHSKLMILDEPTNGLDIPSKSQFRKIILKAMNEETSIIISTHQVRDLHNLIDSIIILDEGNILLNASNQEITSKLYFGVATEENAQSDILYSEESISGNVFVKENKENLESNIDIELLFNSVFQNKERIKNLFSNSNR
ncbi:MAG TPA: ABC transporter ATP-binding protein [Bacteroidales bacterium]|nr:ABC transporter ATP-binding protein [Bacteroidales bacterium]